MGVWVAGAGLGVRGGVVVWLGRCRAIAAHARAGGWVGGWACVAGGAGSCYGPGIGMMNDQRVSWLVKFWYGLCWDCICIHMARLCMGEVQAAPGPDLTVQRPASAARHAAAPRILLFPAGSPEQLPISVYEELAAAAARAGALRQEVSEEPAVAGVQRTERGDMLYSTDVYLDLRVVHCVAR